MKNGLKDGLTLVQLLIGIVCASFVFIPRMIRWVSWSWIDTNYHNVTRMSLHNYMVEQRMGVHSILFWLFFVSVLCVIIYCIVYLFNRETALKLKGHIWSWFPFVLFVIILIVANAYRDTYTYNGNVRQLAIGIDFLGYVEAVLLLFVFGIELYKKIKA